MNITITDPNELKDLTVFELFLSKRNFTLLAHDYTITEEIAYRYWEKGDLFIVMGLMKEDPVRMAIIYPCEEFEHSQLPLAESECLPRLEELFLNKKPKTIKKLHPFKEVLDLLT